MTRLPLAVMPQPGPIAAAVEQISAFLEAGGVDARAIHHAGLIVEELVTNLGTHGASAHEAADVVVGIEPAQVDIVIRDRGPPFDPRSAPEPDLSLPAQQRQVGGLGLFLIRKLTTTLDYEYANGHNCLHVTVPRQPAKGNANDT